MSDLPGGESANHGKKEGRVLRWLMGLFGLVCIGGGLFAGINGKLYHGGSRGANITVEEAPVAAWVLGGIAILIGLALLSVLFSKHARGDSTPGGESPDVNRKP